MWTSEMRRMEPRAAVALGLALLVLAAAPGCKKTAPQAAEGAARKEMTVFVPCSIFGPFCNVLDRYKAAHPDVKVEFDSGNSVVHKRQVLDKGARPDVYIGTGPLETDPLVEAGLVEEGTMRPISTDTVLLTVPKGNPAGVRSVQDLASERVKMIAVPDPTLNSASKFGIEALKKLGVWEKVRDKVAYTELGRTARKYVMDGKVEAAIMYRSCLYEELQPKDAVRGPDDIVIVADLLAQAGMPEITTPGCVLKASRNKALAREFLAFLATPEAQKEFAAWKVLSGATVSGAPAEAKPAAPQAVAAAPAASGKEVLIRAFYPLNEEHQFIADYLLTLPKKFGPSVKVEVTDFRKEDGYRKWRESGLTCGGVLLNGKYAASVTVGGQTKSVEFLGRPDVKWKKEELEAAVAQALREGPKPTE